MLNLKNSVVALFGVMLITGIFAVIPRNVTEARGSNDKKNNSPRRFYLTRESHPGNAALTACATGFHMASLWEIHDPSNLRYDTQLGETADDSGFGPPAGFPGWVRTGFGATGDVNTVANCEAWTSSSGANQGTAVSLPGLWDPTANTSPIAPWRAVNFFCGGLHVWCVEDFNDD